MNQAWVPLVKRVLRQDGVTRSVAFVPDMFFSVLLDLGPHRLQHCGLEALKGTDKARWCLSGRLWSR